jgi:TatD DNase family protein
MERTITALGLHPQLAHERIPELPLFDELLPHARCIGEIGLDGAPEFGAHWKEQLEVFSHILAACVQAGGRIMSIHSRRASKIVLNLIEAYPGAGIPVLHWFSGSPRDLDRAIKLGCWFSVGPAMLNGERGRSLAARMPRDRVLTESDGPFAQLGGSPAMPWDVGLAVGALSGLWAQTHEAVEERMLDNFQALVGRSE